MRPSGLDAIELLFRECFRSFLALPGAEPVAAEGLEGVVTGVPLTFFNGVASASLDGRLAAEIVDEVARRFRSRKQSFRWWVTPQSQPSELTAHLERNGMRCPFASAAMTIALDALPSEPSHAALSIDVASDRPGMAAWAEVIIDVFERTEAEGKVWIESFEALKPSGSWTHFVGTVEGKPAVTTSLLIAGELAGIYHVATRADFRGRRFASALTLHALRTARERGARIGVLQATPVAVDVYKSIGFADLGPLQLYDWRPEYGAGDRSA